MGKSGYLQDNDGEEFKGDEDNKLRRLRHLERWDGGLSPGSKITVVGTVLSDVARIDIDICQQSTGRIKLLHFNPRFDGHHGGMDANAVVRNTLSSQGWGHEERSSPPFPFKRGQHFKLEIRCERDQFNISVDGKAFVDYKYRLPLQNASYLRILGGVEVIHVDVKL